MRPIFAALGIVAALLGGGCSGNTPYACADNDGSSCLEFVSGYTEDEARSGCNALASRFERDVVCPGGRLAHCTISSEGKFAVISYYAPSDVEYERMNCALLLGEFAVP